MYNPYLHSVMEQQYATNPLVQQNLSPFASSVQQPQIPAVMQNKNSYAIIHGIQEARNYPVVPNCTCILFDDEKSEFYKKTVDSMGVMDIRLFEYTEKVIENQNPAITNKAEIDALKAEIAELKSQICKKPTEKGNKKEVVQNEFDLQ